MERVINYYCSYFNMYDLNGDRNFYNNNEIEILSAYLYLFHCIEHVFWLFTVFVSFTQDVSVKANICAGLLWTHYRFLHQINPYLCSLVVSRCDRGAASMCPVSRSRCWSFCSCVSCALLKASELLSATAMGKRGGLNVALMQNSSLYEAVKSDGEPANKWYGHESVALCSWS